MLDFEFTITPDDVREILKVKRPKGLGLYPRGFNKWAFVVLFAVFIIFALWENYMTTNASQPPLPAASSSGDDLKGLLLPLVPWLFLFGVVGFFVFRVRRRLPERIWSNDPSMQQIQSIHIDEAGVRISNPLEEGFIRWIVFKGWAESQNFFLVFKQSRIYIGISKRPLDPPAVDQLRQLLASHINVTTNASPILPLTTKSPPQ